MFGLHNPGPCSIQEFASFHTQPGGAWIVARGPVSPRLGWKSRRIALDDDVWCNDRKDIADCTKI